MHCLTHEPPRRSRGSVRAARAHATLLLLLAVLAAPAAAVRAQSDSIIRVTPPPPPPPQPSPVAASSATLANQLSAAGHPKPSPALTPERVVGIQLDALQHNDTPSPDFGIETTFAFVSPANRVATGPLDRFASVVKAPAYRAMLNFVRAERGPMRVDGEQARQRVTIFTTGGGRASYMFLLSRQKGGEFDGCWMTDGVTRIDDAAPLPHGMRAA